MGSTVPTTVPWVRFLLPVSVGVIDGAPVYQVKNEWKLEINATEGISEPGTFALLSGETVTRRDILVGSRVTLPKISLSSESPIDGVPLFP
jgi:hypothetical protein